MKIEVDVPEELLARLGKEAVESFLIRKAESLYQSLQNHSSEGNNTPTEDVEARDKAWQTFNKRGMSC
jgi:hypothetical protein